MIQGLVLKVYGTGHRIRVCGDAEKAAKIAVWFRV
jgi:hypothetical protein